MRAPRCGRCRRRHLPALPCWAGRYAQATTRMVIATYGTVCHICRRPGATSADHVLPRSRGGTDAIGNLRPAHRRCNSRRGDARGSRAHLAPVRARETGSPFFSSEALETPLALSVSPRSPHKNGGMTPITTRGEQR